MCLAPVRCIGIKSAQVCSVTIIWNPALVSSVQLTPGVFNLGKPNHKSISSQITFCDRFQNLDHQMLLHSLAEFQGGISLPLCSTHERKFPTQWVTLQLHHRFLQ